MTRMMWAGALLLALAGCASEEEKACEHYVELLRNDYEELREMMPADFQAKTETYLNDGEALEKCLSRFEGGNWDAGCVLEASSTGDADRCAN